MHFKIYNFKFKVIMKQIEYYKSKYNSEIWLGVTLLKNDHWKWPAELFLCHNNQNSDVTRTTPKFLGFFCKYYDEQANIKIHSVNTFIIVHRIVNVKLLRLFFNGIISIRSETHSMPAVNMYVIFLSSLKHFRSTCFYSKGVYSIISMDSMKVIMQLIKTHND